MSKKSKKTRNVLIGIALFLAIAFIGLFSSQGFVIVQEEVYIPQYWVAECSARADNMAVLDLGKIDNDGEFFGCTTEDSGKYIPVVNGVQCKFFVEQGGFSYSAYECPADVDNEDDVGSDCVKLQGALQIADNQERFVIDAGKQIFINPISFFGVGDTNLEAEYPSYGLKITQADGYKSATTLNCDASSINANNLNEDFHTIDLENALFVAPDSPLNVVSGLQRAYSNQLVSLDAVAGGDLIYISRPNYYYKVKQAEDGFKYVDTSKGESFSSKIECIPRTTGCSDDAKAVMLEDQSCNKYGGAITSYAPVQGDATQLCKYSCTSGKLKLTDNCIAVQSDCPAEKPLWNPETGECVSNSVADEDEEATDYTLAFMIAIGVLFILIILVIVFLVVDKKKK